MANDIDKRGGTELATAFATSLIEGIDNSRAETPVVGGGKPLLRLLKSGVWVYGQTDEPVQEGSRWAVNPYTVEHGFTCWSDYPGNTKNELLGERMVQVTHKKPMRPDPVGGFEWREQRVFQAKCVLGDDDGVEVLFKTNSIGGMRTFDNFLAALRAQAAVDPLHIVAIVEFDVTDYQHPKYGQIFNPIISVKGWGDMDGGQPAVAVADKSGGGAPAQPTKPRKPSLKVAATADVNNNDGVPNVEQKVSAPSQRPGAAPKRQRPSVGA